jgi:hypothetical protein
MAYSSGIVKLELASPGEAAGIFAGDFGVALLVGGVCPQARKTSKRQEKGRRNLFILILRSKSLKSAAQITGLTQRLVEVVLPGCQNITPGIGISQLTGIGCETFPIVEPAVYPDRIPF